MNHTSNECANSFELVWMCVGYHSRVAHIKVKYNLTYRKICSVILMARFEAMTTIYILYLYALFSSNSIDSTIKILRSFFLLIIVLQKFSPLNVFIYYLFVNQLVKNTKIAIKFNLLSLFYIHHCDKVVPLR